MDQKIALIKELLRQAYAIANEIGYVPNVRSQGEDNRSQVEHYETMHLLADSPKPGPLVSVTPEIQRIPSEAEVLVEPE